MASFLTFYRTKTDAEGNSNAIVIPTPSYSSGVQTVSTMVDSGRNADGAVIGSQVGRDIAKIELQWAYLTALQWSNVLLAFKKNESLGYAGFYVYVRYFDMVDNAIVIRKFYVGDRKATPFRVDTSTYNVLSWRDCTLNLIDVGDLEVVSVPT